MASATFSSKGEINQKHARRFAATSYVTYGPHGIIAEHGFGTDTSGTLPFMVEPSGGLEWRVVYFDHMIIRVE